MSMILWVRKKRLFGECLDGIAHSLGPRTHALDIGLINVTLRLDVIFGSDKINNWGDLSICVCGNTLRSEDASFNAKVP